MNDGTSIKIGRTKEDELTKKEIKAMSDSKYRWYVIKEMVSDLGCFGLIFGLACLFVYFKLKT